MFHFVSVNKESFFFLFSLLTALFFPNLSFVSFINYGKIAARCEKRKFDLKAERRRIDTKGNDKNRKRKRQSKNDDDDDYGRNRMEISKHCLITRTFLLLLIVVDCCYVNCLNNNNAAKRKNGAIFTI